MTTVNQSLATLPTPFRALCVGATAGIGQGAAEHLSAIGPNSHVVIAGRNVQAADAISNSAPHKNIHFKPLEVVSMKGVKAFCANVADELASNSEQANEVWGPAEPGQKRKLSALVLSAGFLSTYRITTDEGLEKGMAASYYSRQLIIRELLTLGALKDDAIIINVLNAQVGDPSGKTVVFDDMYLKNTSILKAVGHLMSTTSIMTQDFAIRDREQGGCRTFIHVYPGFVKTNIMNNKDSKVHFFLRPLLYLSSFFNAGVAPSVQTGFMWQGAVEVRKKVVDGDASRSWSMMDAKGNEYDKPEASEEVRQKVREHTFEAIDAATAK
ncbi:hypothetical protein T439DRAFT_326443 [Meredithblackwellia eburnea MCA 4105]